MKQALNVLGTLLFLLGVFGYIYPDWHSVQFTNNENLFHVLMGVGAVFGANLSASSRKNALLILSLILLAIGIYGFTLKHPTDFRLKNVTAQLDLIDNVIHVLFGLSFAWFWLQSRDNK